MSGVAILSCLFVTSVRVQLRAGPARMMGQWSVSDARGKGTQLPAAVDALLSEDTPRGPTEIMWTALRSCYASEEDAVAAVERNTGTVGCWL